MITAGVGFVLSNVAPLFNYGRRMVEGLQAYDFLASHNTKSIEALLWLFSPRGAQLFNALFAAAFVVAVLRTFKSFHHMQPVAVDHTAPPKTEGQSEAKHLAESESDLAESEPNFVCMSVDTLLTHLRDGIYIEGHQDPDYYRSNALAVVAKVRNKFDPTRRVGKVTDISAEITYRRSDGYVLEVNRGGWMGKGNWVNFEVNDIRELIVAIVDKSSKGAYVLMKDYTYSTEDVPHIMAELQHDFYSVEARLIHESSGALYATYNFSLEIIREPEFKIVLEETKELTPKEIRQELEWFLKEGGEYLRAFPRDKQATARDIEIVDEWEQRIVKFISRYPDLFSTALFLADYPEIPVAGGAQGGNWPSLKKLSRRLATLRQFIDELRRG